MEALTPQTITVMLQTSQKNYLYNYNSPSHTTVVLDKLINKDFTDLSDKFIRGKE